MITLAGSCKLTEAFKYKVLALKLAILDQICQRICWENTSNMTFCFTVTTAAL